MAKKESQQTTLGIDIGCDLLDSPGLKVIILDIEGSDSSERGEEGKQIEWKFGAFSLALVDVLMINIEKMSV